MLKRMLLAGVDVLFMIFYCRREAIEKIMRPVQSEGILSSMCVLLVDLQIAPLEQRPLTAALLLQLDLLVSSVNLSSHLLQSHAQ
jgi:hypothetical protein